MDDGIIKQSNQLKKVKNKEDYTEYVNPRVLLGGDNKVLICGRKSRLLAGQQNNHFLCEWWENYAPMGVAAGLQVLILIAMLQTSLKDPGIIPANQFDPNNKKALDQKYMSIYSKNQRIHYLQTNKDMIYRFKFCETCMIFRPQRTAHCNVCNNCVMKFDHHCIWLGTCVGKRNYLHFMTFISLLFIYGVYVMVFCALSIAYRGVQTNDASDGFGDRWYAIVIFVYVMIFMCFVTILTLYHYKIILKNETTNENLKGTGEQISFKPYRSNKGKCGHLWNIFFGKYFRSLVTNQMIKRSRYFKENPSFPSPKIVNDQFLRQEVEDRSNQRIESEIYDSRNNNVHYPTSSNHQSQQQQRRHHQGAQSQGRRQHNQGDNSLILQGREQLNISNITTNQQNVHLPTQSRINQSVSSSSSHQLQREHSSQLNYKPQISGGQQLLQSEFYRGGKSKTLEDINIMNQLQQQHQQFTPSAESSNLNNNQVLNSSQRNKKSSPYNNRKQPTQQRISNTSNSQIPQQTSQVGSAPAANIGGQPFRNNNIINNDRNSAEKEFINIHSISNNSDIIENNNQNNYKYNSRFAANNNLGLADRQL
eukprot:403367148